MKLGVVVSFNENVYEEFRKAKELGFETCQLVGWDKNLMNEHYAGIVKNAVKDFGVEITAFWCGWERPAVWNFYDGPATLGLVPETYRFARTENLIHGSQFASMIGVKDVVTHAGFIPENPNDPSYIGFINAIRYIAEYCKRNGQYFLFETGQETPVTLMRAIQDIGTDNLGINLDPANLLLYGKANPVDAVSIFGKYIRGVHAKDGEYPVDGRYLGEEKPIGEGRVNFEKLITELKKAGYHGALTIEREISGDRQIEDIKKAKAFLERII